MFTGPKEITGGQEFECGLCIIGAGAAGITLARELTGLPARIILLESGGLTYDRRTHDLCEDPCVGLQPSLTEARQRYFGGSTNAWFGNCWPLEKCDFQPRPWIPFSGWPIGLAELEPYYKRAQIIAKLAGYEDYDAAKAGAKVRVKPFQLDGGRVLSRTVQTCPTLSFAEMYRKDIETAPNIETHLYANVVELIPNEAGNRVISARVRRFDGIEYSVRANTFVLASGGIENARLLLASQRASQAGLANENDLVGRYFMEHPYIQLPIKLAPPYKNPTFYHYRSRQRLGGATAWGVLMPTPDLMEAEQIANVAIFFETDAIQGLTSLLMIREALKMRKLPDRFPFHIRRVFSQIPAIAAEIYRRKILKKLTGKEPEGRWVFRIIFEMVPNPENRVVLSEQRDALGQQRAELHLRLSEIDKVSVRKFVHTLCEHIAEDGGGPTLDALTKMGEDWELGYTHHHMGTTRMSADPKQGVVNANCRAHGVDNLYLAGSSVFPTGGAAAPTLTIVALATRLADHLKTILAT